MKKFLALMMALVMCLGLFAGCGKSDPAPESPAPETPVADKKNDDVPVYKDFNADGVIKVGFVCRWLTSNWFTPKTNGMKEEAAAQGIELVLFDGNDDDDKMVQGVDAAINQDCDAIILTALNDALIPMLAKKCREAGVPLMLTDDGGMDDLGNPIPEVGLDDYALGAASAREMCKVVEERGFLDDMSKLKIIVLDMPQSESFHDRLEGGVDVIQETFPQIPEDCYLWLDLKDGLLNNYTEEFTNAYLANAHCEKWIIVGGDDYAISGTYPVLEDKGVSFKNVLLTNIGTSSQITDMMDSSPEKAESVFFSGVLSYSSGKLCIKLMADLLKNGVELPEFTGYEENVCHAGNYIENFRDLLSA